MKLYYERPCFECYGTGEVDGFNGVCPTCIGNKALFVEVTDPKMLRTALKELTKKPISKLGKAVI